MSDDRTLKAPHGAGDQGFDDATLRQAGQRVNDTRVTGTAMWPLGSQIPGAMLLGRYRVEEMIHPHETNRPGVFKCRSDKGLAMVKVAPIKRPPDPVLFAKLSKLRHRNVLRTYECVQSEGFYYEVQEFCEGGSLNDHLLRGSPTGTEWITNEVVPSVAAGLQYLHSNDIVHRDLKPANIFLRSNGTIVVGDFDIASQLGAGETSRVTGRAEGTSVYMAPEAFPRFIDSTASQTGATVSRASDYYSFGVTLLELVLGYESTSLHQAELPELFDFYLSGNKVEVPREPQRLVTLLEGLLIRNRRKRWTAPEVDRWLKQCNTDQDLLHIAEDRSFSFTRSFEPYKVQQYRAQTIVELAEMLNRCSEDEKVRSIVLDDLLGSDRLIQWITRLDTNIGRAVDRERETWRGQPAIALYRCTVLCDPSAPFHMGRLGIARTPSEWLDNVVASEVSEDELRKHVASAEELEKFRAWIELSIVGDTDLASEVGQILESPDSVRIEEMAFLLVQSLPYSHEHGALETLRSSVVYPEGGQLNGEVLETALGNDSDWDRGVPQCFNNALVRWKAGFLDAWLRQRGLGEQCKKARAISEGLGSSLPDEIRFESFLRALWHSPRCPTVHVTSPRNNLLELPYGEEHSLSLSYTSSGAGIPLGAIKLTGGGTEEGIRLSSYLLQGRHGSIVVQVDTRSRQVAKAPTVMSLGVGSGNFKLSGATSFQLHVTYPVQQTVIRVLVGTLAGAMLMGLARLLCVVAAPKVTATTNFSVSDVWGRLTKFDLLDLKWVLALLIVGAAFYAGFYLWMLVLKRSEP